MRHVICLTVLAPTATLRASARFASAARRLTRPPCARDGALAALGSQHASRHSSAVGATAPELSNMATSAPGRIVLWFRSDLRLHDNYALEAALAAVRSGQASELLPVVVLDHRFLTDRCPLPAAADLRKCGPFRARFLLESVRDLKESFRARGADLLVRRTVKVGLPEEILPALAAAGDGGAGAGAVVLAHAEAATEEVAVEAAVAAALAPVGASLRLLWGHTLLHVDDTGMSPQDIPIVFAQFTKRVTAAPRPPAPSEAFGAAELPLARSAVSTADWEADGPTLRDLGYTDSEPAEADPRGVLRFRGGEAAALARLRYYLWESDCVATYFDTRDGMLGPDFSTKLSPWLALGCLSPRTVAAEVARYEAERVKNKSTGWISFELLVRDWMRLLFLRHGAKMFLRGGVTASDWRWCAEPEQSARFAAWKEGRTGWPLVDANMRELNATGFMSNRGRQNVASFLTQNMNVDWRLGAAYFEERLIDHDVCSNYANWLLAAGVIEGRRANVFDILRQSAAYDAEGDYVRHWLPELRSVPTEHVHSPWTMPLDVQRQCGCVVGTDFPEPICTGLEGPGAAEVRANAEAARAKAEAKSAAAASQQAAAAARRQGKTAGGRGDAPPRGKRDEASTADE